MSFQDIKNGARPSPSRAQSPSQAVAAGIFQINTGVAGFRRLVDGLGTSKDTPDHRQRLHNSRQRILQLVKDTSAKLKSLSELDRDPGVNPGRKIEDAKLARDFQSTLQEFQKVQQLAAERESTYAPSGPPSSSVLISDSAEPVSKKDPEYQPFIMDQKRQELVLLDNEISFNEAMIEEREQGLREVQEQIEETSEIFRDLAVLVHDQGIVIDDISSNIDNSYAATSQSKTQLSKASKSLKSRASWIRVSSDLINRFAVYQIKCWWVAAIVVIAIVVVVVVLLI